MTAAYKNIEARKPTQNPEIPKKKPRSHDFFRKVRVNFCLLPFDVSQEPDGNYSDKLVQMKFFILGRFFRVDFPPLSLDGPAIRNANQGDSRESVRRKTLIFMTNLRFARIA